MKIRRGIVRLLSQASLTRPKRSAHKYNARAHQKYQAEFSNETDEAIFTFENQAALGHDGWAQLAPFGDFPGQAMLKQPDGTIAKFPAIQRMDRAAAEAMVQKFKSPWQRLKRYFTGCPIYAGHPDVPAVANDYSDKSPKGMIVDLEVRDNGLFCKPVFNNEGSDLVENRKLRAFSPYWSASEVGEQPGANGAIVKIFRPELLTSAGLTNNPNLPVQLLNEAAQEKNNMNKTKVIEWLKKHGITIANEATDDQIEAALGQLDGKLGSVTTLANEKTTLTGTITARDGTITTLTSERDLARTNFANERKARITGLLDAAVADGRITAADRATWETRLANETQFANEAEALGKLTKVVKTTSVALEMGGRKVEIANANDRRNAVSELVTAEMGKNGGNYDAAFQKVQRENPALFQAMQQPTIQMPKS